MKYELDKYYTKDNVALDCLNKTIKVLNKLNIKQPFFIEPSAGGGAFMRALDYKDYSYIATDIEPTTDNIIEVDFLQVAINECLPKNSHIVVIGNPPFGKKGKLAGAFINKAFEYSNVVAFILPIQFNKYSGQNQIRKDAKLIYNEPLQDNSFIFNNKDYNVRCCFQVWCIGECDIKDLRIRQPLPTKHSDFDMWQYNCTDKALKYFNKKEYGWDFAVPRQGFKDYTIRVVDPNKLDKKVQWIFFKAKDKTILHRLYSMDFTKLSLKNTTTPGFGKADVVEYYSNSYK